MNEKDVKKYIFSVTEKWKRKIITLHNDFKKRSYESITRG